MTATWKDIPGFPNHQASSDGMIRCKCDGKGRARAGLILRQKARPNGYLAVSIGGEKFFVHRLVCAAFHPFSEGMEVSHENGVRSDNRAENLMWRTHQENVDLAREHGTWAHGETCGHAKLTDLSAMIIRSACRLRLGTHKSIGEAFGVTRSTVGDIANNRTWGHVQ